MRRPVLDWHILIGMASIYVALLLNSVEAARRFTAHQINQESAFGLIGLELLLVLSVTGALFYLASLAGRAVFKGAVAVFLILSAVSAYYMVFFNVVIGFGIVQATLTTDMDLTKEAVGIGVIVFVLAFGVLPAIAVVMTGLNGGALFGRVLMLTVCGLLSSLVIFIYPSFLQVTGGRAPSDSASPLGVVAHSYLPSNWVTGLSMWAWSRYESQVQPQGLMDPADRFTYRSGTNLDETYLVIVIGESARYDRMGILGHSRPNTPEMTRIPNLVAMRATACNTATKLSLQCMFVRPEAVEYDNVFDKQTVREKMVFGVLKKLGFTSELFAMQGEAWFYASVDADSFKHREIIYARNENIGKPIDDMLLIRELDESIASHPRGKHMVILHTKGSHHLYTHRYPRSYAWYTPECLGRNRSCDREQLLNSYDNSIAYTDHFLSQVIGRLKNRKAVVIYTSDHGESIGENRHLHGTPMHMAPKEQLMVPVIIWASTPFLSDPRIARGFSALQARKGRMAHHRELFDSVLGCLGIESDDGGINQRRNLCASN